MRRKKQKYLFFRWKQLLLAVFMCVAFPSLAQRYPFYNISIEQGLIQSQVTGIAQDNAGHLWVGTLGGLSRYDGHSFTSYSVRDGLPDNTIHDVEMDGIGRLWVATKKGLACYDGKSFKKYIFQSSEQPQGNMTTRVKTTTDGTAYCRAGKLLWQVKNEVVSPIPLPGKYTSIQSIYVDEKGTLIASFPQTRYLYSYTSSGWDSVAMPASQYPYSITNIEGDRKGRIWLLSNNGIFISDKGQISRAFENIHLNDGPLYAECITEAADGSMWIGANSGVLRVTDTSVRYYNKQNGFTDNGILDILTDAEGNIWMGSDGQGLYRFSGAPFIAMDESTRLPSAQIMALASDGSDGIYFGSYDAGLYYYKNNDLKTIPFPEKYTPAIVATATIGKDLWIGTRGSGLFRYNGGFRQYTSRTHNLPSNSISSLHADKDGKLWIGLLNGAVVYQEDSFHILPVQEMVVYDFYSIGKDSMLMASGNGIKLYSGGKVSSFITGSAADSATPECFTGIGSQLWIGTSDNGIICYDLKTRQSTVINKLDGLNSEFVYNIYAASDGSIWAGTGFGIYNIRMVKGRPVVTFYGRGQGMTGIESNHNAVLGMPDGTIWFGTTNGAMQYRPEAERMNVHPVSIILQSVKLFGEKITDSTFYTSTTPFYQVPVGLRLPPNKNNLTFTFQALSLGEASGITYRYHMEGLDAQWSDWASINTVTYSALPPGSYTLHVQCSVDGDHIARELTYSFVVITPFHKTTLFRVLIFSGCILLGVSLQYMANKRKQARARMMESMRREEQAKVRERTAEDFHDEVGNKLTRINVLTNVLKTKLGDIPADANRIIDQINDNTGQLYSGTRDILWSLKPSNDTVYEIVHRVRDFGRDLFGDTDIDFQFVGTDEQWRDYRLPMDASRNLIMIFKEAMNNCLKYAKATHVILKAEINTYQELVIQLSDNGIGYDELEIKRGNGLNNMGIRAKRMNGSLEIISGKGRGTQLILQFKIPQNRG